MSMKQSKVIINCAVTGAIHIPTMSEHLPITPRQIADEAVKAARAGASTVHLHARDPKTGKPSSDRGLFREFCQEVSRRSDVVICTTTGGGLGMSPEERVAVVPDLQPELASMNMGSMNFAIFPLAERFSEFKHDWEKPYLEMTRDWVYSNTFHSMEVFLKIMKEHGTKPELECYDVGHLYAVAYFLEQGLLDPPLYIQLIFGILGGIGPSVEHLVHMKATADHLFGEDYAWSALAAGRHQFDLCTVAGVMGGNVRVGMEDNLYLGKGQMLTSNEQSVMKIRRILEELSRSIASPDETRAMLKLKGRAATNFG